MKITVADDLIRIHTVITRAIEISIEQSLYFLEQEKLEDNVKEGFINYVNSLLALFHSHHIVEDEEIFPYFKNKGLKAPYEMMATQHENLLPLLDTFEDSIKQLNLDFTNTKKIKTLLENLEQLQTAWIPHYQLEEEYLNNQNISNLINQEEEAKLCHQFGEYAAKHIEQDYLVIPFILYNLSPEQRSLMAEVFPPIVTEKLVPYEWKEKWQSMSPFLLV
jgi:hemerythrin-like domain-containing protein